MKTTFPSKNPEVVKPPDPFSEYDQEYEYVPVTRSLISPKKKAAAFTVDPARSPPPPPFPLSSDQNAAASLSMQVFNALGDSLHMEIKNQQRIHVHKLREERLRRALESKHRSEQYEQQARHKHEKLHAFNSRLSPSIPLSLEGTQHPFSSKGK